MDSKKKNIKQACDNFVQVQDDSIKSKNDKFYRLDKNLLNLSNKFKYEISLNQKGTISYQKYKRGTIVAVDFGINIGGELCGNHFAIVLSKNDNQYASTLTVVPLTSKNKKNRLALGNLILEKVSPYLLSFIESFEEDIEKIKQKIEDFNEARDMLKLTFDNNESENFLKNTYDHLIKIIKQLDPKSEVYLIVSEFTSMINNYILFRKVANNYLRKNKISYASIENIQTVSKLKVLKPLNKMDPIGKMRVGDDHLDKIDNEIIIRFTNKK